MLPNRILKAAMTEGLASVWTGDVTPALIRLYQWWAEGGAGTLVTGLLSVERGVVVPGIPSVGWKPVIVRSCNRVKRCFVNAA